MLTAKAHLLSPNDHSGLALKEIAHKMTTLKLPTRELSHRDDDEIRNECYRC